MSKTQGAAPLVAVWSPTRVSLFDPHTHKLSVATKLSDLGSQLTAGREVVIAISQRNAFVRTLPVPNVPRAELAKIISLKITPLLPVGGQDYVSGFRIGGGAHGGPRIAIVGAVRADILKTVQDEATRAGLVVKATLPFAFASWLLAKERSLSECAVIDEAGDSITVDIIHGGELTYSRSIPTPEDDHEFQLELDRTFRMADVERLPILASGGVDVLSDSTDSRPLAHQFADLGQIERNLFSLESLEITLAREAKIRRAVATRAIAVAAVAVVLGGYVALTTR